MSTIIKFKAFPSLPVLNVLYLEKNLFSLRPKWYIDNEELESVEHIDYLGAKLGNGGASAHVSQRIGSCSKSFYSLQSVGLCNDRLNVETAMHVFKSTCQRSLTYACESLDISRSHLKELDTAQAK